MQNQTRRFSQLEPNDFVSIANTLHFIANPEVAIIIADHDYKLIVTGIIASLTESYIVIVISNNLVFSEDQMFLFSSDHLLYLDLRKSKWLYQKNSKTK